jgi:sulfur carrier protein ThiS
MKVTIQLFGTLTKQFPHYNPDRGMEVEIPDGTKVRDLLRHLEITSAQGGIVASKGRILSADDSLEDGIFVRIFQPVFGG